MRNIMFVCTGNTCRSSMAEGMLKNSIQNNSELRDEYTVTSSGVHAFDGDPASMNSISVLAQRYGIDISKHKSKMLNKKSVDEAFLILTMTRAHKDAVLACFPESNGKIFTLKEYVSDEALEKGYGMDIVDPYGGNIKEYEKCAEEIAAAIAKLELKLGSS